MTATDFFTVEVCTLRGLATHYVLFFLDLASRAVKVAGVTTHPNDLWMMQIARNLTDPEETFLLGKRLLIMDRDTKYSDAFRSILTRERLQVIRRRLTMLARGLVPKLLYASLLHLHRAVMHGWMRTVALAISDRLRRIERFQL